MRIQLYNASVEMRKKNSRKIANQCIINHTNSCMNCFDSFSFIVEIVIHLKCEFFLHEVCADNTHKKRLNK